MPVGLPARQEREFRAQVSPAGCLALAAQGCKLPVAMFGLSPLPRTLRAALSDARDRKVRVRRAAVVDLGRHAESNDGLEARGELARILREDADPSVRREAAMALGSARALESAAALLKALSDEALEVRQMAILALGEVGASGPEVVRALEQFLAAEGPAFRFQALLALTQIQPEAARSQLLRATCDDDVEVAYLAIRLLDEHWLSASKDTGEIVAALRQQAAHESSRVRLAVGLALVRRELALATSIISNVLNATFKIRDLEDELAAIELAGELGMQAAMPGLRRRAFPPPYSIKTSFVWHATTSLARLGDAEAQAAILKGLGAWSRDKRHFAVVAAGVARVPGARARLEAMRGDPRAVDPETLAAALACFTSPGGVNRGHER